MISHVTTCYYNKIEYNDGILQFLPQTKEYTLKTRGLLRRETGSLFIQYDICHTRKREI